MTERTKPYEENDWLERAAALLPLHEAAELVARVMRLRDANTLMLQAIASFNAADSGEPSPAPIPDQPTKRCDRCQMDRRAVNVKDGVCSGCEAVEASQPPASPLQHVVGRYGLSKDAVADAIYAQQAEPQPVPPCRVCGRPITTVNLDHPWECAGCSTIIDTTIQTLRPKPRDLHIPWPEALSVYDNSGPGKVTTINAFGATICISPTDLRGIDSGRTRYWLKCETCNEILHKATTGCAFHVAAHLRDQHGFIGEVVYAEREESK